MTSVAAVLRDSHSLLPNWSKLLKVGEGGRHREGGSLLIRLRSSTTPTQRPSLFYSVLTNELLQKHLGSSIKDKNDFFFCSVVYWLASQRSLLFKSAGREPFRSSLLYFSLRIQPPHVGCPEASAIRAEIFHTDDVNLPRVQANAVHHLNSNKDYYAIHTRSKVEKGCLNSFYFLFLFLFFI